MRSPRGDSSSSDSDHERTTRPRPRGDNRPPHPATLRPKGQVSEKLQQFHAEESQTIDRRQLAHPSSLNPVSQADTSDLTGTEIGRSKRQLEEQQSKNPPAKRRKGELTEIQTTIKTLGKSIKEIIEGIYKEKNKKKVESLYKELCDNYEEFITGIAKYVNILQKAQDKLESSLEKSKYQEDKIERKKQSIENCKCLLKKYKGIERGIDVFINNVEIYLKKRFNIDKESARMLQQDQERSLNRDRQIYPDDMGNYGLEETNTEVVSKSSEVETQESYKDELLKTEITNLISDSDLLSDLKAYARSNTAEGENADEVQTYKEEKIERSHYILSKYMQNPDNRFEFSLVSDAFVKLKSYIKQLREKDPDGIKIIAEKLDKLERDTLRSFVCKKLSNVVNFNAISKIQELGRYALKIISNIESAINVKADLISEAKKDFFDRFNHIGQLVDALNDVTGNKDKNIPKDYPKIYREFSNNKGKNPLNDEEKVLAYACLKKLAMDVSKRRSIRHAIRNVYCVLSNPDESDYLDIDRSNRIKQLIDALNDVTGNKDKTIPKDYPKIYREFSNNKGKNPLNDEERAFAYTYLDELFKKGQIKGKTKKKDIQHALRNLYVQKKQEEARDDE